MAKLVKHKVEVLQITPSRFNLLWDDMNRDSMRCLKLLLIGGEAFPKALYDVKDSFTDIDIINVYGPTETTVWSTALDIKSSDKLSIGKPLTNEQVYILSSESQLQPNWVTGELCIAGDGVTRGYLHREELTTEKFIANPFRKGERLYRTGDIARWLPNGNIEFLGRKDGQIKIRGNRIELGEIEYHVKAFDTEISNVAIKARPINDDLALIAYYASEKEIDKKELRTHLQKQLPEYMIPNYYVAMDVMPLTPSGKIDSARLPAISEEDVLKKEYIAPSSEIEKQLVLIWEEVLRLERVGVTDDFFALGGHSLMAISMLTKINKSFSLNIDFTAIFNFRSIAELAEYIENIQWDKEKVDIDQVVHKITI